MSVGYEKRRCPTEVAASAVFIRNSTLPPAVRDEALEPGNFTLVSLLRSDSISKKRENIFFTVKEVKLVMKFAWVRGAY